MCTFLVPSISVLFPRQDVSPLPHDTLGPGLSACRKAILVPSGMTSVAFLTTTFSNDLVSYLG